jgi:hypothetical protein
MKKRLLALAAMSAFVLNANAVPPDFTAMLAAVDWSTTLAAIMSIAAGLMVLYLAIKGAKIVLRMVKGA